VGCTPSHLVLRATEVGYFDTNVINERICIPLQKLHATTFGPELEGWRLLLPGRVVARFLCAACCSDAGLIGGREGVEIVVGEGSGNDSVAICGNSLSLKRVRGSGAWDICFSRDVEASGGASRRSGGTSRRGPKASRWLLSTFELRRDNGCDGISGDMDGSSASIDLSSPLSLSLSSPLRCRMIPRRLFWGM
jgi:hypothetical protein